ncbi:hypothetical protein SJS40_01845 [Aeromonas caviae]|uniref:hypothetical protein n=2 Tax=Aeromonas caviae TaxID=648 RepID=UPI0025413FD4|nr:hypothetical protein [Aeromonas caviae]MDK3165695.1 hypothetical protein [Aeromonas caviae]MDX7752326.1 hypothetical protein [Aeromonas caviae]MDX7773769.1 hypothetical protein [Aeromonas caviae]MEA9442639.1 hypothetical protein [Aeromonas caviae]
MEKKSILSYELTGKIVSISVTAIYATASYFFIPFMKENVETGKIAFSLSATIIVFFVGALNIIKDFLIEKLDLFSPLNKERAAHLKTQEIIVSKEGEINSLEQTIREKNKVIHAIQCSVNNVLITKNNDNEKVVAIQSIFVKVNKDAFINHTTSTDIKTEQDLQDYLSLLDIE